MSVPLINSFFLKNLLIQIAVLQTEMTVKTEIVKSHLIG